MDTWDVYDRKPDRNCIKLAGPSLSVAKALRQATDSTLSVVNAASQTLP